MSGKRKANCKCGCDDCGWRGRRAVSHVHWKCPKCGGPVRKNSMTSPKPEAGTRRTKPSGCLSGICGLILLAALMWMMWHPEEMLRWLK
jgi:hypothetical protein